MNYLADGLQQGFAIGSDAVKQKRARDAADKQAEIDRQLRLDLLAKQLAAEKELQNDRLVADAKKQFDSQTFTGGESAKDRALRVSLQGSDHAFTGGQNDLNRGLTQKEIDARAKANADQLGLDVQRLKQQGDQFGTEMGLKTRAQGWQENPANPSNAYQLAHAKYLNPDDDVTAPRSAPTLPNLPDAKSALEWARANPNDPRAKEIFKRLGVAK